MLLRRTQIVFGSLCLLSVVFDLVDVFQMGVMSWQGLSTLNRTALMAVCGWMILQSGLQPVTPDVPPKVG